MNDYSIFLVKISKAVRSVWVFDPYISEIGRVSFVAIAVFGLLTAIGEAVYPGFVINWISPKSVMQLGVIAGFLALWPFKGSVYSKPSWLEGVLGLFFSAAAFLAAWYYFKPIIESRFGISLAVAFAVGLSFCLLVYGDYLKRENRNQ